MSAGFFNVPPPHNEPIRPYAPGDPETAALKAELDRQAGTVEEIPCVIAGQRVFTGNTVDVVMPFDHQHVLAKVHLAGPDQVTQACDTAAAAQREWAAMPWDARKAIFLKAAHLLAETDWRDRLNASTMLGQAKTVFQAEIDSACELIDFWRFNTAYAEEILAEQPPVSPPGQWNRLDHRPLEGIVFAVTPFNFTSIALNLPTAPAMLGNVAVWKPSLTQSLSAWHGMQLLEAAGVPAGVINLVHGHGADVGDPVLARPDLAGLHFTGSTGTFQHLWKTIGNNLPNYRSYPRIVGETGGKDFIVAHPSADVQAVIIAIARGAFEFQGQKCSAASRAYIPKSMWADVQAGVAEAVSEMKMGDPRDFSNFLSAVIDERAFRKHEAALALAKAEGEVVTGGEADGSKGWFVQPTLVRVDDPKHELMATEYFGPIMTVYVYDDSTSGAWSEVLDLVDTTSPYGLTGAVFSQDRATIVEATERLRNAAGNFYINDKPTGAVVGQQPFGGARASGTDDKAGSPLNLLRWLAPRAIKETFAPPHDWRYPFMG